jgi:hypothetical protein
MKKETTKRDKPDESQALPDDGGLESNDKAQRTDCAPVSESRPSDSGSGTPLKAEQPSAAAPSPRATESAAGGELPSSGNHDQAPTVQEQQQPWCYKVDRWLFLPARVQTPWSSEQDLQEFEIRFGKSDCPLDDCRTLMQDGLANLHRVLASGIDYFLKKRGGYRLASTSALSLREKVELFSELLPNPSNQDYLLRFTTTLALILWLESEHSRLLTQRESQQWLYPLYHLADLIGGAAYQLKESLICEHKDFRELTTPRN